jgi:hypothetical protein
VWQFLSERLRFEEEREFKTIVMQTCVTNIFTNQPPPFPACTR